MSERAAQRTTEGLEPVSKSRAGSWHTLIGDGALRSIVFGCLSLLISLVVWQLLSTFVFNPFLIPPPLEVARAAVPMIASGEIFADVAISMTRVMVGFVSGSLAGIALGVLLGRIRLLNDLFD